MTCLKKINEAKKLRKALESTHTPSQANIWEDIVRSQKEVDSLTSIVSRSILNETNSPYFTTSNLFSNIFFSKKSGIIKAKSKWISIQLRKYEESLDPNQLTIYKNLYETEMGIIAKANLIKSILNVGIPFIIFHIVSKNKEKDIKEWEKAIKS